MKISHKIGLGYSLLCFCLVLGALVGYLGIRSLSRELEFLTGPAWETADSCMECSIEIEAQIIATRNIARGVDIAASERRLADARTAADDSIRRMSETGVLEPQRLAELQAKYAEFQQIRDRYVASLAPTGKAYDAFILARDEFSTAFDQSATAVEITGRTELDRDFTLLRLRLEEMKEGRNMEGAGHSFADELARFQKQVAAAGSDRLRKAGEKFTAAAARYHEALTRHLQQLQRCEKFTGEFLDYLAELEDVCDGAVETAKATSVPAAISWANRSLLLAASLGLVIGIVAAVLITKSVTGAISRVVEFSREIAGGNLNCRLASDSRDETGDMARSLNTAVENTARTMEDVRQTNLRMSSAVDEILGVMQRVGRGDYSVDIRTSGTDAMGRLAQGLRDFIGDKQQAELANNELAEREKLHQARQLAEEREKERAVREREAQELLRRKVNQLLEIVSAAAQGDLTRNVPFAGTEPIDELAAGLQRMLDDLRAMIGDVSETTLQLTEGSKLVADTSQGVSMNNQEQMEGLEKIAASVSRFTRSIEEVSNRARQADSMASHTSTVAGNGQKTVNESLKAMELIKRSSSQIGEIVQVIADIARQTNMLALNAAIEAARAGEHGLGFAVVADEVRKLAERTNGATGEITTLIREAIQRVDDGVVRHSATHEALQSILIGVQNTAREISQIASSSEQQTASAMQINEAIQTIRRATEHNAASGEELAASSEELGAQAQLLREIVGRFQVSTHTQAGLPAHGNPASPRHPATTAL